MIVSPARNSFHRIFSDKGVLDQPLERTPQRAGTHHRVVASLDDQVLGCSGELNAEALSLKLAADPVQHQVDDLG